MPRLVQLRGRLRATMSALWHSPDHGREAIRIEHRMSICCCSLIITTGIGIIGLTEIDFERAGYSP
jgi:hypothetical protein